MKAAPKKSSQAVESIDVLEVKRGILEVCVLGTSPYIAHAMSKKVQFELLLPRKKTAADKAANLKHNPFEEFESAPYMVKGDKVPTRVVVPCVSFKAALRAAALDMPGTSKSEIGRQTYVYEEHVSLYGVPQLIMSVVRCADINRTPDIRTRAIFPQWACKVRIGYVIPLLREKAVANLLAAAGIMCGIGDWRQQKGSGSYGMFELVSEKDPRFLAIIKSGGRVAQDAALRDPQPYDEETANLLAFWTNESARRGFCGTDNGVGGGNRIAHELETNGATS